MFFRQLSQHRFHVLIPYAPLMGRRFVQRGTESMRLYEHFLRLIRANAILHYAQRERDGLDIIATLEDLKTILPDFKLVLRSSLYGVSGDALQLLDGLVESVKGSEFLGLADIGRVATKVFGTPLADSTLRNVYVKSLVAAGLLNEELDEKDKRRRLYSVRAVERVEVFEDEQALFAEIEGKPIAPEAGVADVAQNISRTDTGTGKDKVQNWIGKQRRG